MSQTPISVTYSLEEILTRIDSKIDKLDQKFEQKFDQLNQKFEQKFDQLDQKFEQKFDKMDEKIDILTVEMETVKGEIKNLDTRLTNQEKIVSKLDESNKKLSEDIAALKDARQIILPIITALIGTVIGWFIKSAKIG